MIRKEYIWGLRGLVISCFSRLSLGNMNAHCTILFFFKLPLDRPWDFCPRWRHRYIHLASSYNQKKDNSQFKKKKTQNCQKIELYGSLTTKDLKKKCSSRLVGEAEMGSLGGEDTWQSGSWQTGISHIRIRISWEK